MPTLQTAAELLSETRRLLNKADRENSFNRETEARVNALLRLHDAVTATDSGRRDLFGRPTSVSHYYAQQERRVSERAIDQASLAFFAGRQLQDTMVSESGGRIGRQPAARVAGRAVGAVTELRDLSYSTAESRTYAGLNVGTGSQGAYSVPIGFFPEVQFALRQVDGLFASARVLGTPTGNPLNLPTAFESNVGRELSEAGQVSQTNPTFGQVQWNETPIWSSDQVLMSLALAEDAGAPNVTMMMRDIFAIRISLGLGGKFTTDLLSSAHVGATTSSASAITPAEIMAMPTKLSNAAYGYKPTSGWLMNANTLEYLYALVGTSGNRVFPKKFDDDGVPLLLEQKVFLSPSFPDIGAANKVLAYGDLSRYWIREVGDSFTVFRYDELFMSTHSIGFQAWWRADGQLVSADAGVSDFPIVVLAMHA
jgi:HK97 family phage major capsid protein